MDRTTNTAAVDQSAALLPPHWQTRSWCINSTQLEHFATLYGETRSGRAGLTQFSTADLGSAERSLLDRALDIVMISSALDCASWAPSAPLYASAAFG